MGQEPHNGGGAGGVPIHPDASHASPHAAVAVTASLLLHQLLSRHVPRRGAPHRGHCVLSHPRCGFGETNWETLRYLEVSVDEIPNLAGYSQPSLGIRTKTHSKMSVPVAELTLSVARNRQGVRLGA